MASLLSHKHHEYLQKKRGEVRAIEDDAWNKFLNALKVTVGETFLPSAWGSQVSFTWAFEISNATKNLNLFTIAGMQPLWGPSLSLSSTESNQSYELFLNLIFFAADNPELEAAIARETQKLNTLVAARNKARDDNLASWAEFNVLLTGYGLVPLTYKEYVEQFGDPSKVYELQIQQQHKIIADLTLQNTSGPAAIINNARAALDNSDNQMEISSSPKITKPALLPSPDPITIQQNWTAMPINAPPAIHFKITNSSSNDSRWNVFAQGGASYGWFFAVYTNTSFHSTVIDTSSSSFSLEFSARGIQSFSIAKPWYNGALVAQFKNGPWFSNPLPFWGPTGTFNILITEVVAVYKPKITLRLSPNNYHSFKSSWNANAGIRIGPFSFGSASSGGSESNTVTNDQTFEITTEVVSEIPVVLGVKAHPLNYP